MYRYVSKTSKESVEDGVRSTEMTSVVTRLYFVGEFRNIICRGHSAHKAVENDGY